MLPTSNLPMSPFLNVTSMGTLVVLVAVGAAVALLAGYLLHRPEGGAPTITVVDERDEPANRRVNG